jgi:protein-disulfide isomerase
MLKDRFVEIFKTATNGNGNVDKFLADYADSSTSNKIKTDEKMVKADGLNATPTIVIGGNYIDFTQSGTSVAEMFETEIKKALGE